MAGSTAPGQSRALPEAPESARACCSVVAENGASDVWLSGVATGSSPGVLLHELCVPIGRTRVSPCRRRVLRVSSFGRGARQSVAADETPFGALWDVGIAPRADGHQSFLRLLATRCRLQFCQILSGRVGQQLVAQFALEHLALGVPREGFRAEPDVGGNIEPRHPLADEERELVGRDALTGTQDDGGPDLFAEDRMRDADYGDVRHCRMLEEGGLHLDRVHVLASADDHVLRPVDDVARILPRRCARRRLNEASPL